MAFQDPPRIVSVEPRHAVTIRNLLNFESVIFAGARRAIHRRNRWVPSFDDPFTTWVRRQLPMIRLYRVATIQHSSHCA